MWISSINVLVRMMQTLMVCHCDKLNCCWQAWSPNERDITFVKKRVISVCNHIDFVRPIPDLISLSCYMLLADQTSDPVK